jgi:hypothetical protein
VQSYIPVETTNDEEKGKIERGGSSTDSVKTMNGPSGWKMWFSDLLQPYVHFVPVKADLSDLLEKIQWCRDNDETCKKISEQALMFSKKYLTRDSIMDYMQTLIVKLKNTFQSKEETYGNDPLIAQNDVQLKYLYDVMKNSVKPEGSSISYTIPKPASIYNIFGYTLGVGRGSFGWSKGYGLFLKNMFRPITGRLNESPLESSVEEGGVWEKLVRSSINLKGVFDRQIFQNKKGTVDLYNIGGFPVVKKSSEDEQGMLEHVNEAFISNECLNDLLKTIPNFAMSFVFEKTISDMGNVQCTLLNEYIFGETLSLATKNKFSLYPREGTTVGEKQTSLQCPKSMKNMLEVLLQIMLSLQFAQEQCGFIHNDLTPWNVIIQVLKDPITIQYPLASGVYKIITKHVPVIIDYGKSHIVADAYVEYRSLQMDEKEKRKWGSGTTMHYGMVNMFDMAPSQDVFSIVLLTCLDMLTNNNVRQDGNNNATSQEHVYNEKMIFKMLNFFSDQEISTRKDALSFIHRYKKYEAMLRASETLNLKRSPIDFVKWCSGLFKSEKVAFGISSTYKHENERQRDGGNDKSGSKILNMNTNNPRQIFDEAFTDDLNGVNKSFIQVPERLYRCTLPQPSTKLELYMVAQALVDCLKSALIDYREFLGSNGGIREIREQQNKKGFKNGITQFNNAMTFVTDFYKAQIDTHGTDEWTIGNICTNDINVLSRNLFRMNLKKTRLSGSREPCLDLSYFKNKILKVLNWKDPRPSQETFEIKDEDKAQIMSQLDIVMKSGWNDKKITADNNTLIIYSRTF